MGLFNWRHRRPIGATTLSLEKPSYYPGEKVGGIVHLEIDTPVRNARLHVRLVGRTKHRHRKALARPWEQLHYMGCNKFSDLELDINQPGLTLEPGSYDLAFGVTPPADQPGSSHFEYYDLENKDLQACVDYSIEWQLKLQEKDLEPLNGELPFDVTPLSALIFPQPVVRVHHANLKQNLFVKKGEITMTVQLDSDTYPSNAAITVLLTLQADQPHPLECVRVALHRQVQASALANDDCAVDQMVHRATFNLQMASAVCAFQLTLPLPTARCSETGPIGPSSDRMWFKVSYDVRVECCVDKCKSVLERIPVTIMAPSHAFAPRTY